jgi:rSAM/selenodomain-associated transferase 1
LHNPRAALYTAHSSRCVVTLRVTGEARMSSSVVYIVAKGPQPGVAKTRLTPPLTPEQGARVASAFLLDVVDLVRRPGGPAVRAMCRNQMDAALIRALCGERLKVLCQRRPGLGAALEECFDHGLADGFAKVAVLGGDTPTLPSRLVEEAFVALDTHDVVVGPSEDGGYYLLGARAVHPLLFRSMTWSTDRVFHETIERARSGDLRTAVLASWYDVDTPEDLNRLARYLEQGDPDLAPHTRRALASLDAELRAFP